MWIASLLFLQDLFQPNTPERRLDRIELRLPPRLDPPRRPSAGASVSLEGGRGFACGGFDLRSSFRSQFDRQVGEEFLASALDTIQGELVSNGLVLACQVSPTLCDAIKHYRLTAGALLSLQHEQCQSLEEVLSGTTQKIRARSILSCLQERQERGVPLDRALEECQKSAGVRDLSGREVSEVDVIPELARFLRLDDDLQGLLREIGQPVKLGASTLTFDVNLGGIGEAYHRVRDDLEAKWREAARGASSPELLKTLTPPGRAPLRAAELASLAAMPEERREAIILGMASAGAYLQLAHRLEELEKRIQAAETSPTSEELAPILQKQREWLQAELRRLEESYRRQTLYNDALARVLGLLDAELDRQFESRFAPVRDEARERKARTETRAYGGCETKK